MPDFLRTRMFSPGILLLLQINTKLMSFSINGKLHKKFAVESKTATFSTREFVIMTEEQYPQYIKFQLVQDRTGVIDQFQEGQQITVHFDLRGREWQEKYFTNLQAWKVEAGSAAPTATAGESVVSEGNTPDPFATSGESFDDLPF